jgi:hypothetical protein
MGDTKMTTARAGVTRVLTGPDGPVRQYYPTREEQFERMRRDREREQARQVDRSPRTRPTHA